MARYEQDELKEKKTADEARPAKTLCPWCKGQGVVKDGIFHCPRCSYECDISTPPKIRVIGWTTADDNSYLETHCSTIEIYHAIVDEIREKGYSFGWLSHQSKNSPCTPIINNGYKICCAPGTWGTIMADAHGADPKDERASAEYSFLDFSDHETVYPQKHVDYQSIIPFEIDEV